MPATLPSPVNARAILDDGALPPAGDPRAEAFAFPRALGPTGGLAQREAAQRRSAIRKATADARHLTTNNAQRDCGRRLAKPSDPLEFWYIRTDPPTDSPQRPRDVGAAAFNLRTCSRVWSCPHCEAVAAARVARWAGDAIRQAHHRGYVTHHLTLTLQHHPGTPLQDAHTQFRAVLRHFWNARATKAAYGGRPVGRLTAIEITHGIYGWHLHAHLLTFGTTAPDTDALRAQWTRSASLCGQYASPAHGATMRAVSEADTIAHYVTATAHGTADAPAKRAHAESHTLAQILALAAQGHPLMRRLWGEVDALARVTRWKVEHGTCQALGMLPPAEHSVQSTDCTLAFALAPADAQELLRWHGDAMDEILDRIADDDAAGALSIIRHRLGRDFYLVTDDSHPPPM